MNKRSLLLEYMRIQEITLEFFNLTQETFEEQTYEQLDNLIQQILPKPPTLQRQHRLPVDNTREEINSVNNNPGSRIILNVGGGGLYTVWYYGQTLDGRFYKETFTGVDRIHQEINYLDGPLDPNICDLNSCFI
jgi:hypothetical protein